MQKQDTNTTGKVKKFKKAWTFKITHIDRGVEPSTSEDVAGSIFDDPNSGRWPKVSFSTGETYSYTFLTNTKIIYFTGRNNEVFTEPMFDELILEFVKSPRQWNESNWSVQEKRVSTWKPELLVEREKAVA